VERAEEPRLTCRCGDDAVTYGREQSREVEAVVVRDLDQMVGAANQILDVCDTHLPCSAAHGFAHGREVLNECLYGVVVDAGDKPLEAARLSLMKVLDLRGDTNVATVQVAPAADRAADRDPRC